MEHVNTTWGTDETLTVTTEVVMKIDPDVYKAMIGLGIVAFSLAIIAAVLKCFGILYDILNYFRKVFFSSYQMDHCQDQQTNRPGIKSHSRVRG